MSRGHTLVGQYVPVAAAASEPFAAPLTLALFTCIWLRNGPAAADSVPLGLGLAGRGRRLLGRRLDRPLCRGLASLLGEGLRTRRLGRVQCPCDAQHLHGDVTVM